MSEDSRLVLLIAVIWLLIALTYTDFVLPIVSMPMAVIVWGAGGLVFLVLTVAIVYAEWHED